MVSWSPPWEDLVCSTTLVLLSHDFTCHATAMHVMPLSSKEAFSLVETWSLVESSLGSVAMTTSTLFVLVFLVLRVHIVKYLYIILI